MKQKLAEVYDLIEGAVDDAFLKQNLNLKLYEYLKQNNFTKDDLGEILHSPSVINISSISSDLADYIEGGSDDDHKQLREAYGYLSKPLARKVKIYLDGMVDDVVRYKNDKGKRIKKRSK